jgi:hypothetical protein
MITLFEELFLISIHEAKGSLVASAASRLAYGLGGALLAELALSNRVRVEQNHRVELNNADPTGDPLLDKALGKIKVSENPRKVSYWVTVFSNKSKRLRRQIARRLEEQGLLHLEDERMTLVIPYAQFPDRQASVKYWIKNRLRGIVLACEEPDLHDIALLSLLEASGLLDLVFTRDEIKSARRMIYELRVTRALDDTTGQAIEEIEGAVESLTSPD